MLALNVRPPDVLDFSPLCFQRLVVKFSFPSFQCGLTLVGVCGFLQSPSLGLTFEELFLVGCNFMAMASVMLSNELSPN